MVCLTLRKKKENIEIKFGAKNKHYFVQSSYDLSFDDLYFLQAQHFARIKCSCMDFIGVKLLHSNYRFTQINIKPFQIFDLLYISASSVMKFLQWWLLLFRLSAKN